MNTIDKICEIPATPENGGFYMFHKLQKEQIIGNSHGHHKYPAKFIPQFPKWALSQFNDVQNLTVLDPFCGSGTTLVEAGLHGANVIGTDVSDVAIQISKAKTSILFKERLKSYYQILEEVLQNAGALDKKLAQDFENCIGKECHSMDKTWSNWFEPNDIAKIVAIRKSIHALENNELKDILLSSLSSIIKKCSYLDEDQIKVKKIKDKVIPDVYEVYFESTKKLIDSHIETSKKYINSKPSFLIKKASATDTKLSENSIDIIVTSPPYINAIDYTMTHKYSMFALGLVKPEEFKAHCHEYIGVTERAVRVKHYEQELDFKNNTKISNIIKELRGINTTTSKNRSYVVWQYFTLMADFFIEMRRVLKPGGKMTFVVGEYNSICNINVPTAELLQDLALDAGFKVDNKFYHVINNRSGMRLNRNSAGGSIKNEIVFVFN